MKYEILAFNPYNNLMKIVGHTRTLREARKACTRESKRNKLVNGSPFVQAWRTKDGQLVHEIA